SRQPVQTPVQSGRGIGHGAVERDEIRSIECREHRVDDLRRHGARLTRPSGRGWRGRGRRAGGDEEARSRPRVEETAPLEMQISLNDGADADADVAAHRAQRRYALIRFQRAREDLPFDDVGDLLVSRAVSGGHPAPICISEKSRYLNLYHSASGAL